MTEPAAQLLTLLKANAMTLATAESCTGGAISAAITALPGASSVFERGFITYANTAKTEMLGVPETTLNTHGAVSAQTAQTMAEGALKNSRADIAISVTGIAGPIGDTPEKPVGLVYIGHALKNQTSGSTQHNFQGSRTDIQKQATKTALKKAIQLIENTQ